jgi:hypothetical protein
VAGPAGQFPRVTDVGLGEVGAFYSDNHLWDKVFMRPA